MRQFLLRELLLDDLALPLGFRIGQLPSTYFGLPLEASHKSFKVLDTVEERIRKTTTMWK